jgi:hypothetical protein
LETAAFGTLWLFAALLAVLVLILYRQLERAYQAGTTGVDAALLPGVQAPDLEIVMPDGQLVPFEFPAPDQIGLLAFVSSDCDSCLTLMKAMRKFEVRLPGGVIALVNGEDDGRLRPFRTERTQVHWLAHPPDAIYRYGVNRVPLVYAVRGRTVLASAHIASAKGVEDLLAEAEAAASRSSDNGMHARERAVPEATL